MKIELDLDQMLGFEYDNEGEPVGQKDFRNEVVIAAATQLVTEIRKDAVTEARAKVGEIVDDEIRSIVRKAMEGQIQQRTPWGESKGEPQTILEMVRTHLATFLAGTAGGHDPYGNRKPANLRQLIEEVTREVMSKELREDIAAAKKEINNAIRGRAVAAAVEALSKGAQV